MTVQTSLKQIEVASGRVSYFRVEALPLQDSGIWTGIRLEEWRSGNASKGGETAEIALFRHVLALNIGSPMEIELRSPGEASIRIQNRHGTMVMLPAGMPYTSIARGAYQGLLLSISPELLAAQRDSSQHGAFDLAMSAGPSDVFLQQAMLALATDIREGHPAGALFGDSIGIAMAAYLVRRHGTYVQSGSAPGTLNPQAQARILEYIEDNLWHAIRLSELSELVQLTPFVFLRAFKHANGMPPHRFITMKRVARAKSLIKNTTLPLVEVAFQCGFSSQSHMTNVMRRITGLSPMEIRRSVRK